MISVIIPVKNDRKIENILDVYENVKEAKLK
jgi:hypothetical protein